MCFIRLPSFNGKNGLEEVFYTSYFELFETGQEMIYHILILFSHTVKCILYVVLHLKIAERVILYLVDAINTIVRKAAISTNTFSNYSFYSLKIKYIFSKQNHN